MQKGEAIPFILIDETLNENNEAEYKFKIHPKSLEVFNSEAVKNKKIAIATVAGPQRTGKSFLSNRLLKRMTGFAIGPTTMPCTKGLWIWGEPIVVSDDTVLIIMDTEGLNSVRNFVLKLERDVNVDMKIFSLSILLSSVFIYNSIGHIDEKALENMSYVLRISENIKISSDNNSDSQISKYFPFFYWVLRDFSLDLKGKSEGEYLEESLKPISNDKKDPRNQIRQKIRKLFHYRKCECFPRPIHEQNRLAHIQELQYDELRQSFRDKMKMFERTFFSNLPPKTINNKPITGSIYLNLAYEYVNAMNSGKVPQIMDSLKSVILAEVRKVCDNYKNIYKNAMDEITRPDKLPLDEAQIQANYKKYLKMIQEKFQEKFKNWGDIKLVVDAKNKFFEDLAKDLKSRLKQNTKMSELAANRSLLQVFESFKPPEIHNSQEITTSLVSQKYQQFLQKYKLYDDKNKAPAKHTVFCAKFPGIIFDYFGMLVAKIKGIYSQQLKTVNHQAQQYKRELESIKRTLQQQEDLILEKEKQVKSLVYDKDQIKRELKKNQQLVAFEKQTEKMSKKDKNKELQRLKNENLEICNQNEEVLSINQRLKQQIQLLRQRIESGPRENHNSREQQQQDEGQQHSQRIPSNLPNDLVYTLMNLRTKLGIMNQFYDKKAKDQTIDDYMQRQIEEMRNDKFATIDKIKDQFRVKAQTMRSKFEKSKEMYERQIQMMNKHLDDIKKQNINLTRKINENPTSDQRMKGFIIEKRKFEESLRLKQNHLNSQIAINAERERKIDELKQQMLGIQNQFAMLSAEKANLQSFKEQFWYLLRQTINFVQGKGSKLKHAVNKLNPEDQQCLKKTLTAVGVKAF